MADTQPDSDLLPEWPHSKQRLAEINQEMSDGILLEIGETLKPLPCMHGVNHGDSTPPMFFRERILKEAKSAEATHESSDT